MYTWVIGENEYVLKMAQNSELSTSLRGKVGVGVGILRESVIFRKDEWALRLGGR